MSNASVFWQDNLKDVQLMNLPYDRHLSTKVRSGRGSSVIVQQFDGEKLLIYARQLQITPFQLCLALYYVFLFKLTSTQDLIVGGVATNRFRPEFESMIGMFVNLIPYRLIIEPHETFRQLIERVQHLCLDIFPHVCLPFQTITKLHNPMIDISTTLNFETITKNKYSLDNNTHLTELNFPTKTTMFDLSISFKHDILTSTCTCSFVYSLDVFDDSTIDILTRRFGLLVAQVLVNDEQPVYELNLILENERQILNDFNPVLLQQETDCIHWIFIHNTQKHPQKIAIIMEDQYLSYSETLYYAQQLAAHLKIQYHVNIGDIICQLVERSIELILGILAILMCGAVYTPFNPEISLTRLHSCIHSLNARLLLVHRPTRYHSIKDSDVVIVELDVIIQQHTDLRALDDIIVTSDDLSHIVFTSGSTGEPKVVS
jgi:non-ribosomal peptide synthetase component F